MLLHERLHISIRIPCSFSINFHTNILCQGSMAQSFDLWLIPKTPNKLAVESMLTCRPYLRTIHPYENDTQS